VFPGRGGGKPTMNDGEASFPIQVHCFYFAYCYYRSIIFIVAQLSLCSGYAILEKSVKKQ
jgi:hypothetical protein